MDRLFEHFVRPGRVIQQFCDGSVTLHQHRGRVGERCACGIGEEHPYLGVTAGTAQITVLNDAFGKDPSMTKDWGYAALIEVGGKRILFWRRGDMSQLPTELEVRYVE